MLVHNRKAVARRGQKRHGCCYRENECDVHTHVKYWVLTRNILNMLWFIFPQISLWVDKWKYAVTNEGQPTIIRSSSLTSRGLSVNVRQIRRIDLDAIKAMSDILYPARQRCVWTKTVIVLIPYHPNFYYHKL